MTSTFNCSHFFTFAGHLFPIYHLPFILFCLHRLFFLGWGLVEIIIYSWLRLSSSSEVVSTSSKVRLVCGVELKSLRQYTNAKKNNGKFDQNSRSLQISISRTQEEIHQNHPHTHGFYLPFDQSDQARARVRF